MTPTTSPAAQLSETIAQRVDLALADPATQAKLAARGISLDRARSYLIARTESELDRPATAAQIAGLR